MKLPRRNLGKQYLPSVMNFRAPGAIAPPQVTVVGTPVPLFVPPPRVRVTYKEDNQVLAQALTLTLLPWLSTISWG